MADAARVAEIMSDYAQLETTINMGVNQENIQLIMGLVRKFIGGMLEEFGKNRITIDNFTAKNVDYDQQLQLLHGEVARGSGEITDLKGSHDTIRDATQQLTQREAQGDVRIRVT